MIDLKKLDVSTVSVADCKAELERELKMRVGVYTGWMEAGKMSDEKASQQFTRLKRAYQLICWQEANSERVKLAMSVLNLVEKNPAMLAAAVGDEAIKMLANAFPGAKLVAIKSREAA